MQTLHYIFVSVHCVNDIWQWRITVHFCFHTICHVDHWRPGLRSAPNGSLITAPSITAIIHRVWRVCVHCTVWVVWVCVRVYVYLLCSFVLALCPRYVLQYWFLMARGWIPIDPSVSINMLRWLMVRANLGGCDSWQWGWTESVKYYCNLTCIKPGNNATMYKQAQQHTREI